MSETSGNGNEGQPNRLPPQTPGAPNEQGLSDAEKMRMFNEEQMMEDLRLATEEDSLDRKNAQPNIPSQNRGLRDNDETASQNFKILMGEKNYQEYAKIIAGESTLPKDEQEAIKSSHERVAKYYLFIQKFGSTYFTQEDHPLLAAMFIPDKFAEYANDKKKEFYKKFNGDNASLEEKKIIDFKISEAIKEDMTLMYGNILRRIDVEKAGEFFEEIVKEDMWEGINMVQLNLTNGIHQMFRHYEDHRKYVPKVDFDLYKRKSKKLDEEKDYKISKRNEDGEKIEGTEEIRRKPFSRIEPESEPEKTTPTEFVELIKMMGQNEFDTRRYLHNVRALSYKAPDGKVGYFGSMAGYAGSCSSVDIDEMMTLPDADVMLTATQLYTKVLLENFVKNDWKHEATMFLREKNEKYTLIERDVYSQLEKIFSEKFGNPDTPGKVDPKYNWRLRRAMDMAIGLSKGVYLNELEISASADPVLTPDGKPRFMSYFTTDPNALVPFDAKHLLLRFQSEGMIAGPILFTPIDRKNSSGSYNHNEIFGKMDQFFRTFLEGKSAYGNNKEDKVFMDYLSNMGNVGGMQKRGGWRYEVGMDGWFVNNSAEDGKNHLENLKRIENIGYEAISYYCRNYIKPDFLNGKEVGAKESSDSMKGQRKALFEYMFSKYIKPTLKNSNETYDTYLVSLQKSKPGDEAYKYMIDRSLYGVISNRFSSFLIKNERDRFSDNGKRIWYLLKEKSEKNGLNSTRFDEAMGNIGIAETILRKKISEEMDESLLREKDLGHISTEYRLTEEKIREYLGNKMKPEELTDAISVFKLIQEQTRDEGFIKNSIEKFTSEHKDYKYAVGIEELDSRYIAYRSSGGRVLPRVLGDIGKIEMNVQTNLMKFLGSLHTVAVDEKHDFSPLLGAIASIKNEIESIHGPGAGEKVAANFIKMAITYYRKDDSAKWFMGVGGMGRKNSIAAEMLGRSEGVWEWDGVDVDKFMTAVETARVLRREPYAYGGSDTNKEYEEKSFMGLKYKVLKASSDWAKGTLSQQIRDEYGANTAGILTDLVHKYGPGLALFFIFSWLGAGYKEFFDKKNKS